MKKLLIALSMLWFTASAVAQTAVTLPIAAQTVADIGNGPIKVRVTSGNASIFTSQGSGVGSTAGVSTSLTLTAVPTTVPLVGGIISGTGITSGTTVTAYSVTSITLSASASVSAGTAVSWGSACPASAAGIPTHYIQASVGADYYLLYTQARICAVAPGGPSNSLIIQPVFYDSTTPGGGGSGGSAVSSVFGRIGAVVSAIGDYAFSQIAGTLGCTQHPPLTGDVTTTNCAAVLATVNANIGSFGSATQCATITVNGKGLITAASAATCTPAFGSVTGQASLAQLPTMNANTVLSNWTAGATTPLANTWPSCANDGTHALVYVNGSGLVCSTITTGSGTVTSITLTGTASNITLSGTCTSTTAVNCTFDLASGRLTKPTYQTCSSGLTCDGTAKTYTTPANVLYLRIKACGAGGGGGGITGTGGVGGTMTFGSTTAIGGSGGIGANGLGGIGGTGGVTSTGTLIERHPGNQGSGGIAIGASSFGGQGAASVYGGPSTATFPTNNGGNSPANSCMGASGAANGAGANGGGGGSGEYVDFKIDSPAATYSYTCGAGGTAGSGTNTGGVGGSCNIVVEERYNFLLRRDLNPANDNTPMWLNAVA